MTRADHGQQFDFDGFVDRVADRAEAERDDALFYAQAVVSLIGEIVPEGMLGDLEASLPPEYEPLFELVGVDEDAIEQSQ